MPYTELTLVARGNIAPFRFVSLSTSTEHGAVQAGDNADVIGVAQPATNVPDISGMVSAQHAAVNGQQIMVAGLGSVCLLEVGGTVTAGTLLRSNASGQGIAIASSGTTVQNYGAIALQNGSSGERIEVQVLLGKHRPALS